MTYIKSKENNFYKHLKKLNSKKYRDEYKEFLIEGLKVFDFVEKFKYILIKESKNEKFPEFLEKDETFILADNIFDEISIQENSQGIMFVLDFPKYEVDTETTEVVILDNIQDPGNLGTLIRLVDAVGIKNLILLKGTCDIYNEKVVRSTMGSLFNLNINYFSLSELSEFLLKNNFNILATALTEDSKPYDEMQIKLKNAIIFGNEGHGISKELLELSNDKLIIPIYGKAESLNVSVAAGIFLYKYRELKKLF